MSTLLFAVRHAAGYKASQFNRAVAAMRQPGSTFKLFVFYAALKKGFTLSDRIDDRPIEIDGWSPENSGGRYRGRVSLAEAFARFLNAATVALAQEVGIDNVAAAAKELGIDAVLTKGPALALGASEVNLLDLTGAYAWVRAGRSPIEPWGVIDFQAEAQPRAFRIGPQIKPLMDSSEYQQDLITLLQLVVEWARDVRHLRLGCPSSKPLPLERMWWAKRKERNRVIFVPAPKLPLFPRLRLHLSTISGQRRICEKGL